MEALLPQHQSELQSPVDHHEDHRPVSEVTTHPEPSIEPSSLTLRLEQAPVQRELHISTGRISPNPPGLPSPDKSQDQDRFGPPLGPPTTSIHGTTSDASLMLSPIISRPQASFRLAQANVPDIVGAHLTPPHTCATNPGEDDGSWTFPPEEEVSRVPWECHGSRANRGSRIMTS